MAKAGHSFQLYVSLYIFDIIIFLTFNVMFKGGLIIPFGVGHFPQTMLLSDWLKITCSELFCLEVGTTHSCSATTQQDSLIFSNK